MWRFESIRSRLDGWNDVSIAHFKDNVLKNLAREIIQNSLDAREDKKQPVNVKFSLVKVDRDSIPDLDYIKSCMEDICATSMNKEGDAQKLEIKETLEYTKKSRLPVLIIEDSNTSGMCDASGMSQEDAEKSLPPFDKYMRAEGSSGGDQGRAGSHGIGKAAPVATTPLRTIFVATMWENENGESKTLYQGRSRLMYRKVTDKGEEKTTSGIGYWGEKDFKPKTTLDDKRYEWLERKTRGTTIAVPGFRTKSNRDWQGILAGYIVADFFAAISRGTLEVTIENNLETRDPKPININSEIIKQPEKFFLNKQINIDIEKYVNNDAPEIGEAYFFNQCITKENEKVQEFVDTVNGNIEVRLRVLIKPDVPKNGPEIPRKICFVRRDMKITDNLKKGNRGAFWAVGRAPSSIKDFVGVVEILNDYGKELFRSMEPPQHNALNPQNMPPSKQAEGEEAFTALSKWLRDKIEEIALEEISTERTLSELNEYFHDSSKVDPDASSQTKEENLNGRAVIARRPMKPKPPKKLTRFEGDEPGRKYKNKETPVGPNPNPWTGPESGVKASTKNIELPHTRIVRRPKADEFIINIKIPRAFDGNIEFIQIGATYEKIIKVKNTNFGKLLKNGTIEVSKDLFDSTLSKRFEVSFMEIPRGGFSIISSETE